MRMIYLNFFHTYISFHINTIFRFFLLFSIQNLSVLSNPTQYNSAHRTFFVTGFRPSFNSQILLQKKGASALCQIPLLVLITYRNFFISSLFSWICPIAPFTFSAKFRLFSLISFTCSALAVTSSVAADNCEIFSTI